MLSGVSSCLDRLRKERRTLSKPSYVRAECVMIYSIWKAFNLHAGSALGPQCFEITDCEVQVIQCAGGFVYPSSLLLLLLALQQPNTIQGRVSDPGHSPIANARIEFHYGTDTRLATTDDDGTFVIPNVAGEGTLLVLVSPTFAILMATKRSFWLRNN